MRPFLPACRAEPPCEPVPRHLGPGEVGGQGEVAVGGGQLKVDLPVDQRLAVDVEVLLDSGESHDWVLTRQLLAALDSERPRSRPSLLSLNYYLLVFSRLDS